MVGPRWEGGCSTSIAKKYLVQTFICLFQVDLSHTFSMQTGLEAGELSPASHPRASGPSKADESSVYGRSSLAASAGRGGRPDEKQKRANAPHLSALWNIPAAISAMFSFKLQNIEKRKAGRKPPNYQIQRGPSSDTRGNITSQQCEHGAPCGTPPSPAASPRETPYCAMPASNLGGLCPRSSRPKLQIPS